LSIAVCLGNTTLATVSSLNGVDSAEEHCYTQLLKAVKSILSYAKGIKWCLFSLH